MHPAELPLAEGSGYLAAMQDKHNRQWVIEVLRGQVEYVFAF
jgi:hypothetical protein